jgi:CBS domain-containing protein/SAM-dependent methyltransferase
MESRNSGGVPVRNFMSPVRGSVREDASVRDAARLMVDLYLPVLPVVGGDGRFKGVVTQMEIVWVLAHEKDASTMPVSELMTPDPGVPADLPFENAQSLVPEVYATMLFVVEDGELVGFVSPAEIQAQVDLERVLGSAASDLITEISPQDAMFTGWRGAYFSSAASALGCIRASLRSAGKDGVRSVLDLPCGHGRVLRMVKVAFPDASLAACDIDRDGVDFCERVFAAKPIYSRNDPTELDIDRAFDFIWCGSLFTHLPAERWDGFLELFERALVHGGVVTFTTAGRVRPRFIEDLGFEQHEAQEVLHQYEEQGFGYVDPGARDGGVPHGWGLALSQPEWVEARIAKHPALKIVSYAPRTWRAPVPLQDVVTCVLT